MRFLLCVILITSEIMVTAGIEVNYNNRSIVDTQVADSIREPRLASVKDVTEEILSNYDENELLSIEVLNLRENNIGITGAAKILKFAVTNLKNLVQIDLSYNRIQDVRGYKDYEEFEYWLQRFLKQDSLQSINLGRNYLDLDWYRYIRAKLPDESLKIMWQ